MSLGKISLAGAALGFVAYCVYFDRKRRSDPDFKRKLKESMSINLFMYLFLVFYSYMVVIICFFFGS